MVQAGYSPSVRLFETNACGTLFISDYWQGFETIFEIGKEILMVESSPILYSIFKKLWKLRELRWASALGLAFWHNIRQPIELLNWKAMSWRESLCILPIKINTDYKLFTDY